MNNKTENKIRLLRVINSYDALGGLQIFVRALDQRMIDDGKVDVHAIYFTNDKEEKNRVDKVGVKRYPVYKEETKGHTTPFNSWYSFLKKLNRTIKEEDIDIVQVNYPYYARAAWSSILVSKLFNRKPTILTHHGDFMNLGNPVREYILRSIFNLADAKVGVCKTSAMAAGSGSKKNKDALDISSFVDYDFFDPKKGNGNPLKDSTNGDHLFIYPARIVPAKGQEDLVDAVRIAQERYGNNFSVVIVGSTEDKKFEQYLKEKINKLDLKDRVTIHSPVSQEKLRDMYSESTLIIPSHREGLPLVLLEALSMERPVITTRVGGVTEVIEHGENGVLVEPRNPESLAEGIGFILQQNPEKLRDFGRKGRKIVTQRYSLDKVVENHYRLYEQVLRKN